jgi:hypothetical protein
MLDQCDTLACFADTLAGLTCEVEIPADWSDYFDQRGVLKASLTERRRTVRYYLRQKAILEWRGQRSIVYTKDISRVGLSLLHSEQLFPQETCRVWLTEETPMTLGVARCLRVGQKCFECGLAFVTPGDMQLGRTLVQKIAAGLAAASVAHPPTAVNS